MQKKYIRNYVLCLMLCFIIPPVLQARDFKGLPEKGKITMIDLGAKTCIPCKMMAPILDKLEKRYAGIADIIFIDVWENKDQASRFGVRAIPTQIFYDRKGQEVYRHIGFFPEEAIISQLKKMGVPPPAAKSKKPDEKQEK